jgi:DNA-binding CsgD family transcriptional regulator/PAS domain-containing protein
MSTPKHLKISHDQMLTLITQIHDAALDTSYWPQVLSNLASVFQAQESVLRILDSDSKEIIGSYQHNSDAYWHKDYMDYYIKIDPWVAIAHKSKNTIIACSHHLIPDRDLRKSEFYNSFLEPIDLHYGAGGVIDVNPTFKTFFTFQREFSRGEFTKEHLELVKKLSPHLNKSVLINFKTSQLELENNKLRDALSQINCAIVLVNRHGNALFVNRLAETLSQQHRGVSISSGGIRLSLTLENERLRDIIYKASVRRTNDTVPVAGGMKYRYPGNKNGLSILVSPLNPDNVEFDFETTRCALVFLSENHPKPGLNAGILSQIYNLTEAETKIAKELCQGLTLSEISEKLRISNNTIKTHLKSLFHKTDTRRQVELVNLINTGPAGIRYSDWD